MKTAVRDQVNRMDAVELLHAARAADEDQSAGRGRCADARASSPGSASFRARISTPASSTRTSPSASRRSPSTGSCSSSRSTRRCRTSTAGSSPPRPASTAPTTCMRALVTAIGLGANRPQDAVYPTSLKDADGSATTGRTSTSCTSRRARLPPVEGFWSVTMYDAQLLLRRQPDQSLLDQRAAKPQDEPGRLGRSLHPEGLAGRRQGVELAACAGRKVHPDAAHVLAERERPIDPRWQLDHTASNQGELGDGDLSFWPDPRAALRVAMCRRHGIAAVAESITIPCPSSVISCIAHGMTLAIGVRAGSFSSRSS